MEDMIELLGKSNNHGCPLYGVCVCVPVCVPTQNLVEGYTSLSAWFTDEGHLTSRQFSKKKKNCTANVNTGRLI